MSDSIEIRNISSSDYNKIGDTEASIVNTHLEKDKGRIIKLAGCIGEESIRLHINSIEYKNLPIESKPYISITISVSNERNHLTIGSTHLLSPLYKSDYLTLYFDDGSTSLINFIVGGHKIGNEKRNYTQLTDHQFMHICNRIVSHVDVYNSKEMINIGFGFENIPNRQYSTKEAGQYLFQIMAKRLMGIKLLLKNK